MHAGGGRPATPACVTSPGRCYVYVLPCTWEDHCKVGFSRDPLGRMQDLHRRWFEFFDLAGAALVETETVRDARELELELRRPLAAHRAPAPLMVRRQAAGHTEWLRGAARPLQRAIDGLAARGHVVHAPPHEWLRAALRARSEQLYAWTLAQLSADELQHLAGHTPTQRLVRDALDAYAALEIDVEPLLPVEVFGWYRGG
ncbi:GIY-YIG nuclease family protein [Luteimonas sp. RD2P54]|uniref:GIY-YIG nuclease family protein n=1 Tax=Luteimonas endophytica TaxID=3042023 RepID=A0ABT6J8R2_9GAMM|nr:GIY-YIG nuclease family protein [Luteimonas endophytica]MDH5822568.1 GIY-YIG nuclease family protein [Luteimonas endophytica]